MAWPVSEVLPSQLERQKGTRAFSLSCCSSQVIINFSFTLIAPYGNYGPITCLLAFLRDSKFQETGRGGQYGVITSDKNHESQP